MCEHDDSDYIHPLKLISEKSIAHSPELLPSAPVKKSVSRRQALAAIGALSVGSLLLACSKSSFTSTASAGATSSDETSGVVAGTCAVVPTETEGPYPASNVLASSSIYRSNITTDIATGTAKTGVPLTVVLNLMKSNGSCVPISNAAVYIWHCDKNGEYSGYSSGQNGYHASETFLRGVQTSDSNGQVSFTTIYPGWYNGRITHVHFEIFLNNSLTSTPVKISQMAFPASVTTAVYNSSLYSSHGQNSITSYSQDNIFSDGVSLQLATLTGSVSSGYVATLNVGINT